MRGWSHVELKHYTSETLGYVEFFDIIFFFIANIQILDRESISTKLSLCYTPHSKASLSIHELWGDFYIRHYFFFFCCCSWGIRLVSSLHFSLFLPHPPAPNMEPFQLLQRSWGEKSGLFINGRKQTGC